MEPRDMLESERTRIRELAEGTLDPEDAAEDHTGISTEMAQRLLDFGTALDPDITRVSATDDDGRTITCAPGTVYIYLGHLRRSVQRGLDLLDTDIEEINDFMARQHDERGLADDTVITYQTAACMFYRVHDDLGIDPDEINVLTASNESSHDERDMFTDAEIDALRSAAGNPRDRALLELLIHSGQRLTAIRTLRIRDIDLANGVFYLNEEYDREHGGLKGATRRGLKRPLLGARKFVRDWLQYHPNGDDPDEWLFAVDRSSPTAEPATPLSPSRIRTILREMAAVAGVTKPVNPHNFRHYWVTIMHRDYDLDKDDMRALLGVTKDSTIFETTYNHVTIDDHIEGVERALGFREEPEGASPLTPDVCPTCGEILEDHWRQCPACSEVFAEDLKQFETGMKGVRDESVAEVADPDVDLSRDELEAVGEIVRILDDPIALAKKFGALSD